MRHLLSYLLLLVAGAVLLRPGDAWAQGAAFTCDGTFYQIRQVGSTSQIFTVDRSSAAYTTTALNIMSNGTSNDLGVLVNGLAFNSQDGYMYALSTPGTGGSNSYNTISVYKIGQGGIVKVGGPVTVSGTALGLVVASGTFDKVGNYYFTSQNTGTGNNGPAANYNVYRLQPAGSTPAAATQLTTTNAGNYTLYDLAFNPSDSNLYGVNGTGSLYKVALSGGTTAAPTAATVTQVSANSTGSSPIGSAFFDVAGNMYGYSNGSTNTANSGGFYSINLSTGAYTLISNIDPASVSDGASCINPGSAIDVTKELTNVKAINAYTYDVSYAIRVRNTYTATLTNVQVTDLLKGNVSGSNNVAFPSAQSISIVTAPVVTNYDGAGLVANPNFNGQSTASTGSLSGGALLDGTQPLTAGQRALITFTVRVTYADAGSVPTTTRNNTAYASSTSVSPDRGYTLTSNDTLLSPNDLVANDASTNTSSFPALRTTTTNGTPDAKDSAVPTPVTFAPGIAGTVFEDVNYGGGLGRGQGSSQGVGRSGARVELYTVASNGTATYSSATTTAADGSYSFTGLTAGASYVVRVVSSTVTSSRNAGNATGLVGVQTYRTSVDATNGTVPDPNRVGGEYPARAEAANGASGTTIAGLTTATTAAESISSITLSSNNAPAVDVNFGYNFDTVVNTNDTGQGSLRQFIANANALQNSVTSNGTTTYLIDQDAASTGGPNPAAGVETSIFMIADGKAHDGLLAYNASTSPGTASQLLGAANSVGGTVAVITPATALPTIGGTYGAFTTISGATQTQNVGDTNPAALVSAGTVGANGTALAALGGLEVQITSPSTPLAIGLNVGSDGTNTTINGVAVSGFGSSATSGLDSNANGNIVVAGTGATISNSAIGTTASANAAPSSVANADGIRVLASATGATITGNLVAYNSGNGIDLASGATGATIAGNQISNNAQSNTLLAGLDAGATGASITGNLISNNAGAGLDSQTSGGSLTIANNTVSGNGRGTATTAPSSGVTAGVRVYGASNSIKTNQISGNYGAGVLVTSGASTTTISQNSTFNNGNVTGANTGSGGTGTPAAASGELAIDLQSSSDNANTGTASYVTVNDNGDPDTGGNDLLNFPVLTSTTLSSTALVVTGYARPGSKVEFFLAQANALGSGSTTGNSFGQGASYLATPSDLVEGQGNDTNGSTGTYGASGATVNGINQGTDNTNLFTFSLPLSSLTAAQVKALQSGTALLTSTATLSSATSEFSGQLAVPVADVTVALNGATTLYAGQPTGSYTATFTNEGPQAATNVARVVTLPAGATATAAQAPGATIGTDGNGNTTLTYPTLGSVAANGTSVVKFSFTAPGTLGSALTLTATTTADSQGANAAADVATLSLTTTATADATAAVTATASATTGTITATFGNNGPQAAAGLVPTVQLPAGLAGVSVSSGWSYNSSTGLVSYGTTGASLNAGSTLGVTITYPLSTAPGAPVTAVASITTSSDEAGRTANNTAQAVVPAAFDLTTTLSGPASVLAGSPLTLFVTTTNNGPNTAPDATQTVSIPSAASLANTIYLTNGGTYSYDSGTKVGTVTFPALASVPAGQTVTNSITFPAPSASFAPVATVSSTGTETSTSNNTAYLNGATSSTAVAVSSASGVAVENESTTIVATAGGDAATVVAPGTVVTYTVTSTNKGGAGATASATATEKVQLLPGLTSASLQVGGKTATTSGSLLQFASAGGTSTYDPATGVLTYYQVTQAPGTTTTYDAIALTAPAAVGNNGQLLATATVSTNLSDNVPADNVASVGVRVATTPDVTTTVSGPASTGAGQPVAYVVKYVNNGPNNAYNVTETAQLPAGLGGVSILDAAGNAVSGASYDSSTGQVTLPAQSVLASGAEQQYTIQLTAPGQTFPVSSAVASNTADGVASNNTATQTTTVTPSGDLAVSISGPTVSVVGNTVTYVVTTTNNGPNTASNAVVKLQVPAGLTLVSSSTSGSSSVSTGGSSGPSSTAATVSTSNGVDTYTFPTTSTLVPGGSTLSYLSFQMPNASSGAINALASVSSATTDLVASNNTAGLTTSTAPATTTTADLRTTVSLTTPSGSPTSVEAGTALTYSFAYRNAGSGSGSGSAATNVVPTASLPAGLAAADLKVGGATGTLANGIITFGSGSGAASGATYNVASGLLTFPTLASVPAQASPANANYAVSFPAPVSDGTLSVVSAITSSTSDPTPGSNFSVYTIGVSRKYDLTTSLSGPATAQPGAAVSYAVTTLNNGPNTAAGTATQTVTGLPTTLGVADLKVDGLTGTLSNGVITYTSAGATVATYTQSSGTLAFPAVSSLTAGVGNERVHAFSLAMPTAGSLNLTATVTNADNGSASESNANNNTANLTTTPANIAPVAQNVWNSLQSPRGNTANAANANGLPLSPLRATDADGSVSAYTVMSLPNASTQGTLYLNDNGSYSAITAGQVLTAAQAGSLTFAPAAGTAGDVTFTYTATDNGNGATANALTSPLANYTIMVAPDQSTTYAAYNGGKGGTTAYQTGDVLTQVIDPNTSVYTAAGRVYDASTGKLLAGAANGLSTTGTNATLVSGTLPGGVSLNLSTGTIYVSDASQLANVATATTYTITLQTVDSNGGANQVTQTFTIGAYPLPVQLTAFTAQTVQNRDALLSWLTASELRNDHFEVERSLDGTRFVQVGRVAGQGNKASSTSYAFTDAGIGGSVAAGQPVYYRLRQVDQDGTSTYSPVRTVRFGQAAAAVLTLFPNPAAEATSLDLGTLPATGTYQVLLLDAAGRQVRQLTLAGGQVQPLDVRELATGVYSVLVTGSQADGSALHQVLRLTKE